MRVIQDGLKRLKSTESKDLVQQIIHDIAGVISAIGEKSIQYQHSQITKLSKGLADPKSCVVARSYCPEYLPMSVSCDVGDALVFSDARIDLREKIQEIRCSVEALDGRHRSALAGLMCELHKYQDNLKATEGRLISERLLSRKLRLQVDRLTSNRAPQLTSRSLSRNSHGTEESDHTQNQLCLGAITVRSLNSSRRVNQRYNT